jgi:futalosine hydrolase
MVRKILIVTATEREASGFRDVKNRLVSAGNSFSGTPVIDVLVTGIGSMACARGLLNYFHKYGHPDLAINAGIAGSFTSSMGAGSVAVVARDCFADFGIDDRGHFIPAVKAGLAGPSAGLYTEDGWIESKNEYTGKLIGKYNFCTGITSDLVSGSKERISILKNRFNPDLETMEGATFFYICALEKVPFIAIRAVSNMVDERDRASWNIPLALMNLEESMKGIITLLT